MRAPKRLAEDLLEDNSSQFVYKRGLKKKSLPAMNILILI